MELTLGTLGACVPSNHLHLLDGTTLIPLALPFSTPRRIKSLAGTTIDPWREGNPFRHALLSCVTRKRWAQQIQQALQHEEPFAGREQNFHAEDSETRVFLILLRGLWRVPQGSYDSTLQAWPQPRQSKSRPAYTSYAFPSQSQSPRSSPFGTWLSANIGATTATMFSLQQLLLEDTILLQ